MFDDFHHNPNMQTAMPTLSPRAETTRAEIVATAERLFRSLGYQKTAVADIARELGMSPANIYRFFPSKAAINEAICARTLSVLDELAWRTARVPTPRPTGYAAYSPPCSPKPCLCSSTRKSCMTW